MSPTQRMLRALLASIGIPLLTACAAPGGMAKHYTLPNTAQVAPVNLVVTVGAYSPQSDAVMLKHITSTIKGSGVFSKVETSTQKYPLTLAVKYQHERPFNLSDAPQAMLAAATMLVVPATLDTVEKLDVALMNGEKTVFAKAYSAQATFTQSIYADPMVSRKQSANKVLEMLLDDMVKDDRIPRQGAQEPALNLDDPSQPY